MSEGDQPGIEGEHPLSQTTTALEQYIRGILKNDAGADHLLVVINPEGRYFVRSQGNVMRLADLLEFVAIDLRKRHETASAPAPANEPH